MTFEATYEAGSTSECLTPAWPARVHDAGDVGCGRRDFLHRIGLGDVAPMEREAGFAGEQPQAVMLEPGIVVGVEVIEASDGLAAAEQGGCHVIADEAGGAGQQNGQGGAPKARSYNAVSGRFRRVAPIEAALLGGNKPPW